MAVVRKDQKEEIKNVLLRVSIPAPRMAEIKKTKKLCKDNDLLFDIKPDVIDALTKAVKEARELAESEKKKKAAK